MFTNSAPLGRVGHRVAMSVCLCVCAIGCSFFQGLSLALRSHDQFQTSHWLNPPHPSLKIGVLLNDRVCWNDQCYAQFDSKADRVTGMGTNSE